MRACDSECMGDPELAEATDDVRAYSSGGGGGGSGAHGWVLKSMGHTVYVARVNGEDFAVTAVRQWRLPIDGQSSARLTCDPGWRERDSTKRGSPRVQHGEVL